MAFETGNGAEESPACSPERTIVKVFSDSNAAEIAAANLKANGLSCWLEADDCGGMCAAMDVVQGVTLLVEKKDLDTARALLSPSNVPDAELAAASASATTAMTTSPPFKLSRPQILSGIVVGVLLCLLYQWTSKFETKIYRYDYDSDGKSDEVWTYKNDYPLEAAYDRNRDGEFDFWERYDPSGRRILAQADANFDGKVDTTSHYTNGMLGSVEMDTDFNGTPDVSYFYRLELVTRADWRPNGTNVVTSRFLFRHGVAVEELQDTNADGSFDLSVLYDPFQNAIKTNAYLLLSPASE